jgi:hypothetical protein
MANKRLAITRVATIGAGEYTCVRYLIVIAIFFVTACTQYRKPYNETSFKSPYWISKVFDYYEIDSALGGGKTIYGSASLIRLDSNHKVNLLTADFYWKDDSLYLGGEPGIIMKSGTWNVKDTNVLLSQKLIQKTFKFTGERIGQVESDTLKIPADSILRYNSDTLIPLNKPSSELKAFMERDWTSLLSNRS